MSQRLGWYLFCILIIGIFFEMSEPIEHLYLPGFRSFFFLSDYQLRFSSFVYYLCEHLVKILLALIITVEVPYGKRYSVLFFALCCGDALDFWVTASGPWFSMGIYPITFNVLKVLVFILVIIYDYALDYLTDDPTRDVP